MPYIKEEYRDKFAHVTLPVIENVGELNYVLTNICTWYLEHKLERYQTYNDIVGALECAKLEIYRRKIAIYENKKKEENGDVY